MRVAVECGVCVVVLWWCVVSVMGQEGEGAAPKGGPEAPVPLARSREHPGGGGGAPATGAEGPRLLGKTSVIRLIDEEECRDDIRRVCKEDVRNNFAVLECLQNERVSDQVKLPLKIYLKYQFTFLKSPY